MDVLQLLQQAGSGLAAEKQQSLKAQLASVLNNLLLHDFPALVQLLYRTDVSEEKLKALLKENPHTPAGEILADLLIKRQQEKQAARSRFRFPDSASAEERW